MRHSPRSSEHATLGRMTNRAHSQQADSADPVSLLMPSRPQSAKPPTSARRPLSARPAPPRPSSAYPSGSASARGRQQRELMKPLMGSARRVPPPRAASSASPRTRGFGGARGRLSSGSGSGYTGFGVVPSADIVNVLGVGGGVVGLSAVERPRLRAAPHPGAAPRRPRSARKRQQDVFSRPPAGAVSLTKTTAHERPVGLLGAVLRREAAIASLKTAVQVEPPAEGTRVRTQRLQPRTSAVL